MAERFTLTFPIYFYDVTPTTTEGHKLITFGQGSGKVYSFGNGKVYLYKEV